MKAARNFSYGTKKDRYKFVVGEEIPDDVVKKIPDHLVLEKLAQADPNKLTREQLLVIAGIAVDTAQEFDEEQFLEGLRQFNNKGDLVTWANETLGLELLESDGTREELEEMIVAVAQGSEEEE